MYRRALGAVAALAVALAVPAAADAATRSVQAGPFGKQNQQLFEQAFGDGNAYYRKTITIHSGDKVKWKINGFHSVTFSPAGADPPGLILPDRVNTVSGAADANGAPFWFNSQPNFNLNPLAAEPQGGKKFNSGALTSSGLPLAGPPKPYTLKFPKTGKFTYICTVHPGMQGTVKVVKPSKPIPSAKQNKKAAKKELAKTYEQVVKRADGPSGLQNTIQAGNDKAGGATLFKFFPADATVQTGGTLRLQMPPSSSEVHSFTFGPSNGANLYVDELAQNVVGPVFDPIGVYPSEPPPAVSTYLPSLHGNGFWNSGLLDSDPATPLPRSTEVRFGQPGTYSYICIIHPFMQGKVTVNL
jgi:plastocyanin